MGIREFSKILNTSVKDIFMVSATELTDAIGILSSLNQWSPSQSKENLIHLLRVIKDTKEMVDVVTCHDCCKVIAREDAIKCDKCGKLFCKDCICDAFEYPLCHGCMDSIIGQPPGYEKLERCENCGKPLEKSEVSEAVGTSILCRNCTDNIFREAMEESTIIPCADCGDRMEKSKLYQCSVCGQYFCADCTFFDDKMNPFCYDCASSAKEPETVICDCCKKPVPAEDATVISSDDDDGTEKHLCIDCFSSMVHEEDTRHLKKERPSCPKHGYVPKHAKKTYTVYIPSSDIEESFNISKDTKGQKAQLIYSDDVSHTTFVSISFLRVYSAFHVTVDIVKDKRAVSEMFVVKDDARRVQSVREIVQSTAEKAATLLNIGNAKIIFITAIRKGD